MEDSSREENPAEGQPPFGALEAETSGLQPGLPVLPIPRRVPEEAVQPGQVVDEPETEENEDDRDYGNAAFPSPPKGGHLPCPISESE